jgi:hypothetical protein
MWRTNLACGFSLAKEGEDGIRELWHGGVVKGQTGILAVARVLLKAGWQQVSGMHHAQ